EQELELQRAADRRQDRPGDQHARLADVQRGDLDEVGLAREPAHDGVDQRGGVGVGRRRGGGRSGGRAARRSAGGGIHVSPIVSWPAEVEAAGGAPDQSGGGGVVSPSGNSSAGSGGPSDSASRNSIRS